METGIGLVLLMALASVVGFGALLALVHDTKSSTGGGGFVVFGFFVLMAFFFWKSINDPTRFDQRPSPSDKKELAKNELNTSENLPSAESSQNADTPRQESVTIKKSAIVKKPVYEREAVKKLYIAFVAFIPVVLYLLLIYLSDSMKPEPIPVLLLAVFIGSALAIAGCFWYLTLYDSGLALINDFQTSLDIGFIRIALPTEVAKWLLLLVFLAFNKYYDEYFDGIVYSVSLSLGLACILCVGYMMRLVDSFNYVFYVQGLVTFLVMIPLNVIAGAIMGYFIALSKHRNKLLNYALSLILPVLTSGILYSIVAFLDDDWRYYLVFILILTPLAFIVYRLMWHLMELDAKQALK